MTLRTTLFALAVIGFSTCRNPLQAGFDEGLPRREISTFASMTGMEERQVRVITDSADWQATWDVVVANYGQPPALPAVNFDSSAVILAAAGTTGTQLFSFKIAEVRERVSGLFVKVELVWPTCGSLPVITTPVHIVSIPRVDRLAPLSFTFVNKSGPCV